MKLLFKTIALVFIFNSICYSQSNFVYQIPASTSLTNGPVVQLEDSSYIMSAYQSFTGNVDLVLAKYDKFGNHLWAKRISQTGEQRPKSMIYTSSKKLIIMTEITTLPTYSYGIITLDSSISVISNKILTLSGYSYLKEFDIIESSDASVYALCANQLTKINPSGSIVWTKNYIKNTTTLSSIIQISNHSLLLSGYDSDVSAFNSNIDAIQIKIDTSGTVEFSKSYHLFWSEQFKNSIVVNDKIYSSGLIYNTNNNTNSKFILCTDTLGNQLWVKRTNNEAGFEEVFVGKDSTIHGFSRFNNNFSFAKYTLDGDLLSRKSINPFGTIWQSSPPPFVTKTNDDGFIISGERVSTNNVELVKIGKNFYSGCLTVSSPPLDSVFQQKFNVTDFDLTTYSSTNSNAPTATVLVITQTITTPCSQTCSLLPEYKQDKALICVGESVNFENITPVIANLTYKWYVNNVLESLDTNFNRTFSQTGVYKIKLVVSNGICTDSSKTFVNVRAPLSTPSFTYSRDHLHIDLYSDVPNYSYCTWNFNDGTPIHYAVDSTSHNFKEIGNKTICLNYTNICGTVSHCETINFVIDSSYTFVQNHNEAHTTYNGERWSKNIRSMYNGDFVYTAQDLGYGSATLKSDIIRTNEKGEPLWSKVMLFPNGTSTFFNFTNITDSYNGDLILSGNNGTNGFIGFCESTGEYLKTIRLTDYSANARMAKPIENTDGTVIFTGTNNNAGFLLKMDRSLKIHYYKMYPSIRNIVSCVKSQNGYTLLGTDAVSSCLYFVNVDEFGEIIDSKKITFPTYTGITPYSMNKLNDGNYIISCQVGNGGTVIKIDSLANVIWAKKMNNVVSPATNAGNNAVEDNQGNIFTSLSNGKVIKLNSLGNYIWSWSANTTINGGITDLDKTLDNGIVATGKSYNYFGSLYYQVTLFRFNKYDSIPICYGAASTVVLTDVAGLTINFPMVDSNFTYTKALVADSYPTNTNTTEICLTETPNYNAYFDFDNSCTNSTVDFLNLSTGIDSLTTFQWNFQDAIVPTSNQQNPSVTWDSAGVFNVHLTVHYANGDSAQYTRQITILQSGNALAMSDFSICATDTFSLTGSGIGTLTWYDNFNNQISNSNVNSPTNTFYILKDQNGSCIDFDTVNVTVNASYLFTQTENLCANDSILFHGNYYSTTGTYLANYSTSANCDSIFQLNLTIHPIYNQVINDTICFGDSYSFNSLTLTSSGPYTANLNSVNGCDSIVALNLVVRNQNQSFITDTICFGDTYNFNSTTLNSTGIYSSTLSSLNGCDSIIELNLVVRNQNLTSIYDTICNGDTYNFNSTILNSTGIYNSTLTSMNGCDSIVQLNLQVIIIDTSINQSAFDLTSNQIGASYLWMDCNSSNVLFNNTNQVYTPVVDGTYYLEISYNGCVDTSSCYPFLLNNLSENFASDISIYPNPTSEFIFISVPTNFIDSYCELIDQFGRTIKQQQLNNDLNTLNVFDIENGVYFIRFIDGTEIKIIKQ